jgi:hypothetical protein
MVTVPSLAPNRSLCVCCNEDPDVGDIGRTGSLVAVAEREALAESV